MNSAKIVLYLTLQLCVIYVTTIYGTTCQACPQCFIKSNEFPDYYWREYVGIIPEDAVEGGTDQSGNPTYVGQAYFDHIGLLPAIIFPACRKAYTTAYFSELTTDKNIKILCSKHKENLEWIQTKSEETHLLTDRGLVVGGYEVGQTLNIGRLLYDGRVIIGKVFSHPLANKGLWIPYNERPMNFQSYEILTYKTNKDILTYNNNNTINSKLVNVSQPTTININMWNDGCTE
ncbi:hypothetical protein ILUMI_08702 [Ignelater luminosus]|uniref:Uncharacterized protein n=1 Tax=Ignelater luminosus TaxID=2038154 RepID=A0A8K0D755_IGNLU|nr:hypothetical protein ILUMI_08702 [Ignelater luminosus]